MNQRITSVVCGSLIATAALLLTLTGCDTNSDVASEESGGSVSSPSGLTLTPGTVTVDTTQLDPITFTASGGAFPYTWTLTDSALGTLAGTGSVTGATAIYTPAGAVGGNYLSVADQDGNRVTATILQVNAPTSTVATATLAISPNTPVTMSSNDTVIAFTASGGTTPYVWALFDDYLGTLLVWQGGSEAFYTRYANTGVNFVLLTDADGTSLSVSITQN